MVPTKMPGGLMRNHTDTQLVSDVNLLGAVTWRRWPRPEVVDAGEVLFLAKGARRPRGVLDSRRRDQAGRSAEAATLGLRRGRSLLGPFIPGHSPYQQVSAVAVAPTRFYRFAAADFRERLADPAFMESARPAMSQALQADLEDYTRGFLRDPEQRLAALLSNFVQETVATGECVQVVLPRGIDTGDLAALLRITSAELTHLLAAWGSAASPAANRKASRSAGRRSTGSSAETRRRLRRSPCPLPLRSRHLRFRSLRIARRHSSSLRPCAAGCRTRG